MDSLLSPTSPTPHSPNYLFPTQSKAKTDLMVVEATLLYEDTSTDAMSVDFSSPYKGLALSAQQIVAKLNELLKAKLPNGIQSLGPEEFTPEATAERIVQGVTAFFGVFVKQHPELKGEELLNAFMERIRAGIQQGYDEAYTILEGLGAFEFEGVRAGVEKTKSLVEEKLKAYEQFKRQELGLIQENIAPHTKDEVLAQGGARLVQQVA